MNPELDKICRTCMVESPTMLSIFEKHQVPDGSSQDCGISTSITRLLSSFTSIRANRNDGLPANVCLTCLSEINRAVSFKQKCERSEHTLKSYLQQTAIQSVQVEYIQHDMDHVPERKSEKIEEFVLATDTVESKPVALIDETQRLMIEQNESVTKKESKDLEENEVKDMDCILYECQECSLQFRDPTEMNDHIAEKHVVVECLQEDYVDDDETEYEEFTLLEEGPDMHESTYRCSICSIEFARKKNLENHIAKWHLKNEHKMEQNVVEILGEKVKEVKVQTTSGGSNFKCIKCGGKFATKKSLRIHENSNRCLQRTFICDYCSRAFNRKRNLTIHMRIHSMGRLSCPHCTKTYARQDLLSAHIKGHEGKRRHPCPYCEKGFNMLSTLKDHIRVHNGERPYLCSICGKGFSQSTNLKQHLMRHNKTKPFKCTECPNTFVSKGELDSHLRKHTGDHPFVCDVCGSGFTTSSSLVKHKRIHTGERPYACDFCPMRFTALGTLKNHRRTHTGERPFRCTFCDRGFAQRSDCMSHQRTHTGERPYFCKECNKSFLQHSTLKTHMKVHLKQLPKPATVQPAVTFSL